VWDWLRADVMSRLMPGASMIVGNTRWHEDDPIGRLMKDGLGLKWEHIELAAVCDEFGNAIDEQVDPERALSLWPEGGYDLERWAKIRARGEYDWWSLYQQKPRPPGGSLFGGEPGRFDLSTFSWTGKRGLIICDPAATAKTSSDYSVAAAVAMEGYGDQTRMYIVDVLRGQWTIPVLVRKLLDFQRAYLGLPVAVEAFGAFQAVPQMLREAAPGLRLLELGRKPGEPGERLFRADKFTRAQPAARCWQRSGILVPFNAPWVHAFIDEHQSFSGLGDQHDDQVDCTSHGFNRLYQETPAGLRYGSYEDAGA
jgi:predicted phage terminase large subunit-like protein